MSTETDNIEYTGLCMWDSCIDCPHQKDCEEPKIKEEEDKETDD